VDEGALTRLIALEEPVIMAQDTFRRPDDTRLQ